MAGRHLGNFTISETVILSTSCLILGAASEPYRLPAGLCQLVAVAFLLFRTTCKLINVTKDENKKGTAKVNYRLFHGHEDLIRQTNDTIRYDSGV